MNGTTLQPQRKRKVVILDVRHRREFGLVRADLARFQKLSGASACTAFRRDKAELACTMPASWRLGRHGDRNRCSHQFAAVLSRDATAMRLHHSQTEDAGKTAQTITK